MKHLSAHDVLLKLPPHSIQINVLFKGWLAFFLFARKGIRQMGLSTQQNGWEECRDWPLLAFKQTNGRPITLIVQIWVIELKAWGTKTEYHTPETMFLNRCAAPRHFKFKWVSCSLLTIVHKVPNINETLFSPVSSSHRPGLLFIF